VSTVVRERTGGSAATVVTALVIMWFLLLVLAAIAIALTRQGDLIDFARDYTAALVASSALAALAGGLLGGITLLLRTRV